MSFPTVSARDDGQRISNTTAHPINLPTHAAGDLLLVIFSVDGNPTITVDSSNSTAGWSAISKTNNGSFCSGAWLWKVAESNSEELRLTTSDPQCSTHVTLAITPTVGTVILEPTGSSSTSAGASTADSDPPSHTPPDGAQDYLWIVTRTGDNDVVATAAPSSYSNLQTKAGAATIGASTNTAERSLNAASTNPGTFTSAAERWVCWTIAMREITSVARTVDCTVVNLEVATQTADVQSQVQRVVFCGVVNLTLTTPRATVQALSVGRFSNEILAVITAVEWDVEPITHVLYVSLFGGMYADPYTTSSEQIHYPGRIKSDIVFDKRIGVAFWNEESAIDFGYLDLAVEDQPADIIDFSKHVTIAYIDFYRVRVDVIIPIKQWTADEDSWTVDDDENHTADGWFSDFGVPVTMQLIASSRSSDIGFTDEYTVRFRLESVLQGKFDSPINSLYYDDTYPQLEGKPYPIAWGRISDPAQLLPTVFVDDVTLLYHVTDIDIDSFDSFVYDRGAELNLSTEFTPAANGFVLNQNPDGKITVGTITLDDPEDPGNELVGLTRLIRLAATRADVWSNVEEVELTILEEDLSGGDYYPQFFSTEVVSLKEFLESILDGYGLWYYVDETAVIHFGQLTNPDVATPTFEFTDTNVIGTIQVEDDKAPGLSSRISYAENPGAYEQDELAGAVTAADRTLMTNEEYVSETTEAIIPFYAKARTRDPIKLALSQSAGSAAIAKAEVDRWWADLYPKRRRFYSFSVLINDPAFDESPLPQLGDFCTLQSDNFDLLTTPVTLFINKTRFNFSSGLLTIQGWG